MRLLERGEEMYSRMRASDIVAVDGGWGVCVVYGYVVKMLGLGRLIF